MNNVAGKVGVLALQGGFVEHQQVLLSLGIDSYQIRNKSDLDCCSYLIIPGGESTVMSQFLESTGLDLEIKKRVENDSLKVMGTCAGAILLGKCDDPKVKSLNLIDVQVGRNAYGTQVASFVTKLAFKNELIEAMFIRAPRFLNVGPNVEVLATYNSEPVCVQMGNVLILSFHPELVAENSVHGYFLQ